MTILIRRINAGTIAQVYLVIVLLLAVLVSNVFQLSLAIALLAVQLYCAYKPPKANYNLVFTVASLILAPLALEGFAGSLFAVLLVIPVLVLLDSNLKQYALTQAFSFSKVGKRASGAMKFLGVAMASVFLVAVIFWNSTLMTETAVFLSYLAVVSVYAYWRIPKNALQESKTWSRLIAGDSDSKLVKLKANVAVPVRAFLQPVDSWVSVESSSLDLSSNSVLDVSLRFAPPLAGPSKVVVNASVVDSRGLLVVGQVLEPVDLHIIPRARYARWLAERFLQQNYAGAGLGVGIPRVMSRSTKSGGIEFYGCRQYQVGDRLKDLDWRHSFMLNELIVKEYTGTQGQVGIIVADLTAKDAEDADKLAYNLVMSALTLATEALPSALAVYNRKEVLAATASMNPRETLKKALELTKKIIVVEPKDKVLQPTMMRRLKRSIGQLDLMKTESTQRLLELLKFEFDANQEAAKKHPATEALAKAIKNMHGPAVITVVSSVDDDLGALLLALERLKEKGYSTVMVGTERNKL